MPLLGENPRRPTYRILAQLRGEDVFLAHHEIFDGRVVQKTVHVHGLEDALAANEPAFLHRLDHPRITPVREAQYDAMHDRAITFVMPHYPGGSVETALADDYRFSIVESVSITIDALDALAYLHREHNALHRDTKPGNVLLDGNRRRGYLSDFGSAASIDADGGASAVQGTNIYRPPEARPTGRVAIDADLFGIGMMLWEMLDGRLPWDQLVFAEVEARLQRGLRSVPDSYLEFEPHVPDRLRRATRKAISRRPGDRYLSAEEFIRALRRVICIDWRHEAGSGLQGVWIGTWPPHRRVDQRTEYRVTARQLEAGPDRGSLRYEADFRRRNAGWRQTVPDATMGPTDTRGASGFFAAVEASATHREPAR